MLQRKNAFVSALLCILTALSTGRPAAAASRPTCRYPVEAVEIPGLPPVQQIALTFDDGPNPDTTPHVLDILKKYGIKATFFLIGENIIGNEDLVRRELREGHNIGNHTYTHPHLGEISDRSMKQEFLKTDRLLAQFPKKRARVARFPFGESTCHAERFAESLHYNIVGWQIDSCDWSYQEGLEKSDCIPGPALQNRFGPSFSGWIDYQLAREKGGVILMHDAEQYEADHLEKEIQHLLSEGYTFVELDRGVFPQLIHDHKILK